VDAELYLSVPANRELVKSIASRVLLELEPSGVELDLGFLEPLIDLAVNDGVIVADAWDVAGRFGNVSLLGPIVVPLVLQVLREGRCQVERKDLKRAVSRALSSHGRRRLLEIEKAINAVLAELGPAEPYGGARDVK
jgi:hypothetical protein